jgi:hypothetical protein
MVVGILNLLLYPHVSNPVIQREINQGRKRIDICFDNAATTGLLNLVRTDPFLVAREVMVECKNYSRDVANPEFDQLLSRFDPRRGRFGLLVCRNIDNRSLAEARAIDGFRSGQGVVISLTDGELVDSLRQSEGRRSHHFLSHLDEKFRRLRG